MKNDPVLISALESSQFTYLLTIRDNLQTYCSPLCPYISWISHIFFGTWM